MSDLISTILCVLLVCFMFQTCSEKGFEFQINDKCKNIRMHDDSFTFKEVKCGNDSK